MKIPWEQNHLALEQGPPQGGGGVCSTAKGVKTPMAQGGLGGFMNKGTVQPDCSAPLYPITF